MNPQSYRSRFSSMESADLDRSEAVFLGILASLNEAEWRALLSDVLTGSPDAYSVFLPARGEDLVSYAAAIIDRLGAADRRLPARALERITNLALQQEGLELVNRALVLSGLFGDPETLSFLKSLVLSNLPAKVREMAASALTNHAAAVPLSFWHQIDITRDPFMAPAVVMGLAEHAPHEALMIISRVEDFQAPATLQYPIRLAVQRLLATDAGRLQLAALLKDASEPFAKVLSLIVKSEGVILGELDVVPIATGRKFTRFILPTAAAAACLAAGFLLVLNWRNNLELQLQSRRIVELEAQRAAYTRRVTELQAEVSELQKRSPQLPDRPTPVPPSLRDERGGAVLAVVTLPPINMQAANMGAGETPEESRGLPVRAPGFRLPLLTPGHAAGTKVHVELATLEATPFRRDLTVEIVDGVSQVVLELSAEQAMPFLNRRARLTATIPKHAVLGRVTLTLRAQ